MKIINNLVVEIVELVPLYDQVSTQMLTMFSGEDRSSCQVKCSNLIHTLF